MQSSWIGVSLRFLTIISSLPRFLFWMPVSQSIKFHYGTSGYVCRLFIGLTSPKPIFPQQKFPLHLPLQMWL